jgi:hypothetical protein
MANDFKSLKKTRTSSLEKLLKESTKLNSNEVSQDDRFWYPDVDKAGNGYAVIRFLPEARGEDLPWVRIFNHGFQGPGGWYIENSLTTFNEKDPVSEYNTLLWNNGTEDGKEQARKQKRKLTYVSNIYVIKDPANPQNEGKVMLFKYGKKIWDKINEAMNPSGTFEDETPINPFDFWEGADFKLKIRNVEGYRNYDKSEFDKTSEFLDGDDDKLEEVYNNLYSLKELLDRKHFKSYDELKEKLDRVLGLNKSSPASKKTIEDEEEDYQYEKQAEPPKAKTASKNQKSPPWDTTTDADEDLSFFEKLANED